MEMTINQFIKRINDESNGLTSHIKKIVFNIVTDVRQKAIQNSDSKLNKSGYSKGLLRNSIILEVGEDGLPNVSAGGIGVPYAAIHEFGGTIFPKNVKWLTIPAIPDAVGKKALEFGDLKFKLINPSLAILFKPIGNKITVYYWLKKKVTLTAKHYLSDAGNDVIEKQDEYVKRIFEDVESVWSVS